MLLELGRWGSQFAPPSPGNAAVLHAGSYALTLKTFFRSDEAQGIDERWALDIDGEVLLVQIRDGELDVRQGDTRDVDAIFHTDMPTCLSLLGGQIEPDEAIAAGRLRTEGDRNAIWRFLRVCGLPGIEQTRGNDREL